MDEAGCTIPDCHTRGGLADWACQFVDFSSNLLGLVSDGRIGFVNPAGLRMLGHASAQALLGRPLGDLVSADYRELVTDGLEILAEEGMPLPLRLVTASGGLLDAEFSAKALAGSSPPSFLIEARDITKAKQSAEAVRQREAKLQGILKTAAEAVLTVQYDGTIESANPAAEQIFGYPRGAILGRRLNDLFLDPVPDGPDQDFASHARARLLGTHRQGIGQARDGRDFAIEFSVSELAAQSLFIAILRDVSERKKIEDHIRHLAHHDTLTGLPNRHLFHDRLDMALSRARRLNTRMALMYVDLDKFKPINDTLGHEAGDHVLRTVAERLSTVLRKMDTVARVGGDEFVIVVEQIHTLDDIEHVAKKILTALADPIPFGEHTCFVGCSIGISLFPEHGEDAQTLSRMADAAMYAVKEAGRNHYRVYGD